MMAFGRVIPVLPPSTPSEKIMLKNRVRAINHEIRKVNDAVSSGAVSRSEGKIRKMYLEGSKADITTKMSRIRHSRVSYRPLKKYVSTTTRPDSSYATSIRPSRDQADYSATPIFDYSTGRMKPVADTDLPGLPVLKPMDIARANDIRQGRARNKAKQLARQNKITQMEKRAAQLKLTTEARQRDKSNRQKAINRAKAAEVRKFQQMDLQFKKTAQQKRINKVNQKKLNKFVTNSMKNAQRESNKQQIKASQDRLGLKQLMTQRTATREQHQMAEESVNARQRADAMRFRAHAQAREAESRDREVKRFMQSGGR